MSRVALSNELVVVHAHVLAGRSPDRDLLGEVDRSIAFDTHAYLAQYKVSIRPAHTRCDPNLALCAHRGVQAAIEKPDSKSMSSGWQRLLPS